jgi:hypothetical protein
MKKLIILIISNLLIANVVESDAAITINSGVTVTINGDFQNTGSIINEGAIYLIDGHYDHNDDGVVGTITGGGIFSLCDETKSLHDGANLISFYALPEDSTVENVRSSLGDNATGLIGQAQAANNQTEGWGWIGSLQIINPKHGYWLILNEYDELSLCDAVLTDPGIEYDLHAGANLISFPSFGSVEVSPSLPDNIEEFVTSIIGEGSAAYQTSPGQWIGSLSKLMSGRGYWFIASEDISFSFELNTLQRKSSNKYTEEFLDGYEYNQSTTQAFYFIESVENIEVGDWLLSYNGDELIGSRQWQGMIIDIPVMGNDGSSYSEDYLQVGQTPQLKLLKDDLLIDLEGDIPSFEDNGMFTAINLTQTVPIPNDFSLSKAYPNPFNPVTTLKSITHIICSNTLSNYSCYIFFNIIGNGCTNINSSKNREGN